METGKAADRLLQGLAEGAFSAGLPRDLGCPAFFWRGPLRVFAIRGEMRWCGKARLHLEYNLRRPDKLLSLAAVGRIVQWGLEAGRIKPCSFRCEGRAKARRWRFHDGELNCATMNKALQAYLDYYYNRRPHRSLDMRTPNQQAAFLGMAA